MPSKDNQDTVVIGMAGYGTVGSGLAALLNENKEEIFRRTGKDIMLKTIAVRDVHKKRSVPFKAVFTDDVLSIADDPETDIIVELMGGTDTARRLITRALENGKSVVTANKALLAEHGVELFELAAANNCSIAYEASVAGAIPIVQTLKECLAGNSISAIRGILNGTGNYILTRMTDKGADFLPTLREAQELGYAEANPTLDIDGFDTAHKLIILIRLAWGADYPMNCLPISGIRGMDPMDICFAKELGYRIKLLGEASKVNDAIEAEVSPCLVSDNSMLARVDGAFNAIHIKGNAAGDIFLHGLGAGSRPTASAVLGDLIALLSGKFSNTGFSAPLQKATPLPPEKSLHPWYIRLIVKEEYGVLRDIGGATAANDVSIAQVIQKSETAIGVPTVFITHETSKASISNVIRDIKKLGILNEEPGCYKIVDY